MGSVTVWRLSLVASSRDALGLGGCDMSSSGLLSSVTSVVMSSVKLRYVQFG